MGRTVFRGAPELSRLFVESEIELLTAFSLHRQFAEIFDEKAQVVPGGGDENTRRDGIKTRFASLRADRLALIEIEARRVMTMADKTPDAMLRRLGEDAHFGAKDDLATQRDAAARSLWAYLHSLHLFETAERAMQVQIYRDHGKLYEAWSIDGAMPLTAADVDDIALAEEIAARLHHNDGCKVEAVDLPSEDGDSSEVLVAVTFFGAYASQKTVRPDKTTEILYFRPPDELLLVYSRSRQRIEICSRDATERRLVARIFAEDALKHDVSNKPLTQKTYSLARFRNSLKLPIPEHQVYRVRRANITEVQVALGDWTRKVSLSVAPEDDIDSLARNVFGAIIPGSGGGYVTRVRFHIEHVDGRGRHRTLKFEVFGRNKSNIQSERDPAKRALGYDLLEAWGVLERVGDLPLPVRTEKMPQLLALYDHSVAVVSGRLLDEVGIAATVLVGAGYLTRKSWSDVVLFEVEELGEVILNVEGDRSDAPATLTLTKGGSGPQVPKEDILQYEISFDYLRDAILDVLKPIELKGRVREIAPHLHQLGTARIGLADAPIYLARGLDDDKLLEAADRLVRGENNRSRGIVFVPRKVRFPYIGSHVVMSLKDLVDPEKGQIDLESVRVAFEASVDAAGHGAAVHFRKQDGGAGQITVPGQVTRIIIGAKRVLVFERLYIAHRDREFGVKLDELKKYAGFSQLEQLFGKDWDELINLYLYSPRRSFWALCVEPISV